MEDLWKQYEEKIMELDVVELQLDVLSREFERGMKVSREISEVNAKLSQIFSDIADIYAQLFPEEKEQIEIHRAMALRYKNLCISID